MKKKPPIKKELRILFTPEHLERLQRQADLLDMTASAFTRMIAMEKVTALEMAGAGSAVLRAMNDMNVAAEKMEKERE